MPTVARNVGGPPGRIIYTESHDTAGDLNGGVRLPTAIHSADPAGYYARKRSALGAVLVMSSPGTPMLLQGQELLETNSFSDTRAMDWTRTNSQVGTLRLYRDLTLALQHPDGSEVTLVTRRGGSSDNYGSGTGACETMTYTVFDQSAATLIRNGSAPFAGTYRPEGSLNAFNGKPLNGTWRLRMRDSYANNVGTALCWGLRATHEQRTSACTTFSNHPPVAHSTNLWLSLSAPTNFQLGGSDVDGQSVSFEARTTPVHGLFTLLSATNGQSSYTPTHGYQHQRHAGCLGGDALHQPDLRPSRGRFRRRRRAQPDRVSCAYQPPGQQLGAAPDPTPTHVRLVCLGLEDGGRNPL